MALLSRTSYGTGGSGSRFTNPDQRWSTREVLALVADRPRDFAPGSRYEYSNTNYVLLGAIIEVVTGQSWAKQVRARILDPLELQDTGIPSWEERKTIPVTSYIDNGDVRDKLPESWPALDTVSGAAGAVVSTAPDIVRFTRALFGGELLPADLLASMSAPGPHDRRYDGYGLGVERTVPDRQTLTLGHGGGLVGYGVRRSLNADGGRFLAPSRTRCPTIAGW